MFMPANGFPRSYVPRGRRSDPVDDPDVGVGSDPTPDGDEKNHPGPIFDDAIRTLAEADLPGLCQLLDLKVVGEIEHLPSEFPSWSKRADLLLRVGPRRLAHVEYAYRGDKTIVPQMLWYRCLIMRKFGQDVLDQYVVVLGSGKVRGHDDFEGKGFALKLGLVYLRERDPKWFMDRPSMVPLAVLGRGDRRERERAYADAIRVIRKKGGERTEELLDCIGVLAQITLDREGVRKMIGSEELIAGVVDFYHDTALGRTFEGIGRERGLEEGRAEVLTELLTDRFGPDPSVDEISRRLARWPSGAFRAAMAAQELGELVGIEPPA